MRSSRAQSSAETIILVGIILVMLIPLMAYFSDELNSVGQSKLTESMESLRSATQTVASLGVGSSQQVVISNPKGVEKYSWSQDKKIITITIGGQDVTYTFPVSLQNFLGQGATWPITEGLHRLTLYNNGNSILVRQCGNSVKEINEQCDNTDKQSCAATCNDDCTCYCETDTDCALLGGECDEQTNSCVEKGVCGDTVVNPALGETCDDGNAVDGDGCTATCKLEYCGDSIIQPGLNEECDDGNQNSEDGCSSTCQEESCGDGILQISLGEACDEGANNCGLCVCDTDCTFTYYCPAQSSNTCGIGVCDAKINQTSACTTDNSKCKCVYTCNNGGACQGKKVEANCSAVGVKNGKCDLNCQCKASGKVGS